MNAWVAALPGALLAGTAVVLAIAPVPRLGHPAPGRRDKRLPTPSPPTLPSTYRRRAVLAGTAGGGSALLIGGAFGLAVGAVVTGVVWRLSARMEEPAARRRREALAAGVPVVVDLLAATLASGLAPRTAVERIAEAVDDPMREELRRLASGLRYGADPVAAWRRLATDPHLGPVGRCVSRAVDSGASVADAMHRLAEDVRRDQRAQVEARAHAVGVRAAVPLGVCMLPAFVLLGVVPLVAGFLPVVLGR